MRPPARPPLRSPSSPFSARHWIARHWIVRRGIVRRGVAALCLRAVVSAAAAAMPGIAPAQEAASRPGTLRVVPHADLQVTDPIWTTAAVTRNHGYLVYDVPLALDSDHVARPQMLESWTVAEDGLSWTLALREGLLFHDGSPVRAADLAASLQRWAARRPQGRILLDRLDGMEAEDERTLHIRLIVPFPPLPEILADPTLPVFVMREADAVVDPRIPVTEQIGSGPFTFAADQWVPGDTVIYPRFADYVPRAEPADGLAGGKVARFDRVEWVLFGDSYQAAQALLSGDVDLLEMPPFELLSLLRQDDDVIVAPLDPLGAVAQIRPNHRHPPFDDPRARRALLHLVDQAAMLAAIVPEAAFGRSCAAIFACGTPYETAVGAEPFAEPDRDAALRLLEEAGYDGTPLVLLDPIDAPIAHDLAQALARGLRDAGVNVDLQGITWEAFVERRAVSDAPGAGSAGWHLLPSWWAAWSLSTPLTHRPLIANGEERSWFGWPDDPEIEALRAAYVEAPDAGRRAEIVEALQRRAYETVPFVPAGQFTWPAAWRSSLDGLLAVGPPVFWNVGRGEAD